ncbi:zinc finger protein 862-like [Mya arenaria]|uniref:zinc finger protein 862-like n=1 Tax=Mya arenaria TaxID=6604 RepID=UPI0022DFFD7A|nr:zinc finger protein 862-like [Mya arenaria]
MQNLCYLAKRNDASSAISDLNKLIIHHNVSKFQPAVKSDNTLPYANHESVKEMQEAMRDVVRQQLIDDIRDSDMYAMMCDESTDVSNEKTLVVYVRYAKRGRAETKFFEVSEINGDECNAVELCETISRVLESMGVNLENMCCITTDGASVMTGVRGGLTTLLKRRDPHLLSIHCIAHRLALASGQAADKVQYLVKYQAMINTIFKYYNYSPKHQSRQRKFQEVYKMAEKKFKQTFHTRWLSFEGAVDAVIINYDALLTCLEMEVAEDSDPVTVGLLNFVSNYKFLSTSYMLRDLLSKLCTLSLVFQMTDVNLTQQTITLEATLQSLQEMTTTPGPIFWPAYLMVLNPENLPQNSTDLATYGDQQIHDPGKHYGPSITNQQSPMTVSEKHLKCEWSLFKHHMDKNYRTITFSNMAETVLTSKTLVASYPNLCKIMKIAITLPLSTADCERGFSKYNLIKTKPRNRLTPDSVNTLMTITVDTPDLDHMKDFNFCKAFDLWASTKQGKINTFFK